MTGPAAGRSPLEIAARDFANTKGLTSWVCPDCKIDFKTPSKYRAHRGPSYVDECNHFKVPEGKGNNT